MGMSSAATRYLLAIYELSAEGGAVRSVDVTRTLGVSPASVVHMLNILRAEGLIHKRHYGRVQLADEGVRAANRLYTKCALLESFLVRELDTDRDTARRDAEACLCSLSEESLERIACRVLGMEPVISQSAGAS